jgi:predicted dehydrogenase
MGKTNTMSKTRIAILGAGFMGSTHGRAYATRDDVEIVSIYAQGLERAGGLAEELGAVATTDLDQVLEDDSIDAIDICLPTPAHRATTEAALAAGKHVLLEKPLAMTVEDGLAIVEAADTSDRLLMIAHVLRFWPEYVALKAVIDTGELGKPVSGVAARRQPYPAWLNLAGSAERTGGAIYDMLVHDFDALNWVLGTPNNVTAHGVWNPRSGGYDHAQVLIGYDGGTGMAEGGMIQPESYPFTSRLEVLCEHGAVEYHFQAGGRSFEVGQPTNSLKVYRNDGDPEILAVEQTDAYVNETGYFIDCIRRGVPADRATPRDALLASRVGLAARESVEFQRTVSLERD